MIEPILSSDRDWSFFQAMDAAGLLPMRVVKQKIEWSRNSGFDWPHSPLLDDFDIEFAFGPDGGWMKWVPIRGSSGGR